MLPIRTILHATDFSESSSSAFRFARAMTRDYGARLVVLHVVVPPPVLYAEGIVFPDVSPSREELRAQLEELQVTDCEVVVERRLVEGDPAIEILRAANDTKCDAIVIGTHGRSGLSRLLMGSVAEQVVRGATCPVITVKQAVPEATRPAVNAAKPVEATANYR